MIFFPVRLYPLGPSSQFPVLHPAHTWVVVTRRLPWWYFSFLLSQCLTSFLHPRLWRSWNPLPCWIQSLFKVVFPSFRYKNSYILSMTRFFQYQISITDGLAVKSKSGIFLDWVVRVKDGYGKTAWENHFCLYIFLYFILCSKSQINWDSLFSPWRYCISHIPHIHLSQISSPHLAWKDFCLPHIPQTYTNIFLQAQLIFAFSPPKFFQYF